MTKDSIHASKGQACVCVTCRQCRGNWLQNNTGVEEIWKAASCFRLSFLKVFIYVAIIVIMNKSIQCC